MSIHQIKVQPLTQKAFSQYGTCIDLPAEGDYELPTCTWIFRDRNQQSDGECRQYVQPCKRKCAEGV